MQRSVWSDLAAIRRYFWLPLAAVIIAVGAALALGAFVGDTDEARFRVNVVVDALPPLFGPPVLPGPFDYAAVGTSDAVVADVAAKTGTTSEALRPRLKAEPRVNSPEINLTVTGKGALSVARAWEASLREATIRETPAIEQRLVEPYRAQQEQARAQLQASAASASANPDDAVLEQGLAAAEENYKTASMLVQSYDTVTATMKAQAFTVKAPHEYGGGPGSMPARLGAAAAI
ncbi:MAG: hypothetical protein HY873_11395, partial [Chloroflexi bacterium]|nr:hypothetical protein [Chloroflexota bacterium]